MAEEKVPLGWRAIQWDVERVQKACEFEKTLLELWKSHAELAKQVHLLGLYAVAEKGTKDTEKSLEECLRRTAELKKEIPGMIKKWEDYWKKPFPLPELKKKVEEW